MCGGSPKAPAPPPRLPEAPVTPDAGAGQGAAARDKRRRAAAGSDGESSRSTILTSARGVTQGAATSAKTLLGA